MTLEPGTNLTLAEFTEPGLLVPRLLGDCRESAISELSIRLQKTGRIDNAWEFTHDVLLHESLVSTVFEGVAFSSARGGSVKEVAFLMGLSPQGVRWGLSKTQIVHAVVIFAVPQSAGQSFLSLVMTFSKFLHDQAAFSALSKCSQPEEMFALLGQIRILRTGPQSVTA